MDGDPEWLSISRYKDPKRVAQHCASKTHTPDSFQQFISSLYLTPLSPQILFLDMLVIRCLDACGTPPEFIPCLEKFGTLSRFKTRLLLELTELIPKSKPLVVHPVLQECHSFWNYLIPSLSLEHPQDPPVLSFIEIFFQFFVENATQPTLQKMAALFIEQHPLTFKNIGVQCEPPKFMRSLALLKAFVPVCSPSVKQDLQKMLIQSFVDYPTKPSAKILRDLGLPLQQADIERLLSPNPDIIFPVRSLFEKIYPLFDIWPALGVPQPVDLLFEDQLRFISGSTLDRKIMNNRERKCIQKCLKFLPDDLKSKYLDLYVPCVDGILADEMKILLLMEMKEIPDAIFEFSSWTQFRDIIVHGRTLTHERVLTLLPKLHEVLQPWYVKNTALGPVALLEADRIVERFRTLTEFPVPYDLATEILQRDLSKPIPMEPEPAPLDPGPDPDPTQIATWVADLRLEKLDNNHRQSLKKLIQAGHLLGYSDLVLVIRRACLEGLLKIENLFDISPLWKFISHSEKESILATFKAQILPHPIATRRLLEIHKVDPQWLSRMVLDITQDGVAHKNFPHTMQSILMLAKETDLNSYVHLEKISKLIGNERGNHDIQPLLDAWELIYQRMNPADQTKSVECILMKLWLCPEPCDPIFSMLVKLKAEVSPALQTSQVIRRRLHELTHGPIILRYHVQNFYGTRKLYKKLMKKAIPTVTTKMIELVLPLLNDELKKVYLAQVFKQLRSRAFKVADPEATCRALVPKQAMMKCCVTDLAKLYPCLSLCEDYQPTTDEQSLLGKALTDIIERSAHLDYKIFRVAFPLLDEARKNLLAQTILRCRHLKVQHYELAALVHVMPSWAAPEIISGTRVPSIFLYHQLGKSATNCWTIALLHFFHTFGVPFDVIQYIGHFLEINFRIQVLTQKPPTPFFSLQFPSFPFLLLPSFFPTSFDPLQMGFPSGFIFCLRLQFFFPPFSTELIFFF